MATPMLKAQTRDCVGTNRVTKKRREGITPGVVYSRGEETQPVYLSTKEMDRIISHYGMSGRISLELDGKKTFVIIKEVQRTSLKNELLHVDFQTLNEDEKIRMSIPINLINRESVESGDAILQVQLSEVEIQTYPRYLPDRIEADALKLKEQDNLTLADLNIAEDENIEILNDITSVIASIVYATVEEETEETTEEEVAEETEETEE